jgi:hypothetical protein
VKTEEKSSCEKSQLEQCHKHHYVVSQIGRTVDSACCFQENIDWLEVMFDTEEDCELVVLSCQCLCAQMKRFFETFSLKRLHKRHFVATDFSLWISTAIHVILI